MLCCGTFSSILYYLIFWKSCKVKSYKTRTTYSYLVYIFYRACFCLLQSADFTLFLFFLGRHCCHFAVCAIWKDAHNILQQQIKDRQRPLQYDNIGHSLKSFPRTHISFQESTPELQDLEYTCFLVHGII